MCIFEKYVAQLLWGKMFV